MLTSTVSNTGIVTINFDRALIMPWYMIKAEVVVAVDNTTVAAETI